MEVNLTAAEISATLSNEHVLHAVIDKGGYSESEESVAAGKAVVAVAISNKGVATNKNDSFQQMAKNVDKILIGYGGSKVYELADTNTLRITTSIAGAGGVI